MKSKVAKQTSMSLIKKKIKKSILELNIEDKAELQAIALKYDVEKDKAPKIISVGEGHIAQSILKLAEEHQIPMYEDANVAGMLSKLKLNRKIPRSLFPIVAEILAVVFQMDKNATKRLSVRRKFAKI